MEEPYNPRLLQLFRERMVMPQRQMLAETIQEGVERGQIRSGLDVERILDPPPGRFLRRRVRGRTPRSRVAQNTVDALWPALAA